MNASFGPVPVFPDLMGFGPVTAERAVDWALQFDRQRRRSAQAHRRAAARAR